MNLWSRIINNLKYNDYYIDNITITELPHPEDTIRFEIRVNMTMNDEPYEGQSYMKYPGNMTHRWSELSLLKELQDDLPNELNWLSGSKNIKEVLLSTAIASAIYSRDIQEWPHKYNADIAQRVEAGVSALYVDNHGVKINHRVGRIVDRMMERNPKEIYILQNSQLYHISADKPKIHPSDAQVSDIYPDKILISDCFYPSIEEMDKHLNELFSLVNYETASDITLFGPLITIDPGSVLSEYRLDAYATSQYNELNTANPQKAKMIYTPTPQKDKRNPNPLTQLTTSCR